MPDSDATTTDTPPIPDRLRAIAELATAGEPLADIGCDHGQLAVWAVHSGRVPRAIASDAKPAPLARARAHVATWDLDGRVAVRLGAGLDPLAPSDALGTVCLAGMGGRTIAAILAPPARPARLLDLGAPAVVVQANGNPDPLAEVLGQLGYACAQTVDGPPGRWPWRVSLWRRRI